MPVQGDWKGGGIRQNIEMTGKALSGQTMPKSPKAALLVLPKPSTFAEIVDRGRQGFRCVFLLRDDERFSVLVTEKLRGVQRTPLKRKSVPCRQHCCRLLRLSPRGNCVSPCRQCGQAALLFLPPHNNASEKVQRSRRHLQPPSCSDFSTRKLAAGGTSISFKQLLSLSKLPYPAHFTVRKNEGGRKSFQ